MQNGIPKQGGWGPAMPPPIGTQVRVDLSKATQKACMCGCKYFIQAITVYTISALVSPTGQEMMAQLPVLLCRKCKLVLPMGNQPKQNGV